MDFNTVIPDHSTDLNTRLQRLYLFERWQFKAFFFSIFLLLGLSLWKLNYVGIHETTKGLCIIFRHIDNAEKSLWQNLDTNTAIGDTAILTYFIIIIIIMCNNLSGYLW